MISKLMSIGELCDVRIGRTPRRDSPQFWGGSGVWVTVGELNGGTISSSREHITELAITSVMPAPVPVGTLLFSFKLSIGKMAVAGVPLHTNEAIAALVIKDETVIDREFLRFALRATSTDAGANHAVLGKVLNKSKVEELRIPVPTISEQRRIVDQLSRAEGIVRLRRQAQQKAAELIPAIFVDMFGDPVTNPKGWKLARLGEVADVQGGLQVTKARSALTLERPYLRVANVHRSRLDLAEIKTIRLTDAELDRTRLELGDLLFVEGHGNPQEVGRVAIWDNSIPSCTHQNHLIRARARADVLLPAFACALLNSASGRQSLLRAGKTTSGLSTISAQNVKDAKMLLPPLASQEEFRRQVKAVEGVGALQDAATAKAESTFRSLLAQSFTETGPLLHVETEQAFA
jgi:type I restriction enzyme, S subunit